MTPSEFAAALGWPRTLSKGTQSWVSERGTCVSAGAHGIHVTHKVTGDDCWVPCDRVGLRFVQDLDADRPIA